MNNNEWRLFAYKVDIGTQKSFIDQKRFSILTISLAVQRNRPFYELTLFVPILVMTLLSPLGLILPGKDSFNMQIEHAKIFALVDAGEKMGLQITVLLTMIIYVEVLQTNIPVFDSYSNTPMILVYFIITILMICFCLLLTSLTLFLYHVNE